MLMSWGRIGAARHAISAKARRRRKVDKDAFLGPTRPDHSMRFQILRPINRQGKQHVNIDHDT
jgi:hypothetical protein